MENETRIADIVGQWREQRDRGEAVRPEDVIARHPEIAEELRARFAALQLLDLAVANAFETEQSTASDSSRIGTTIGPYRILSMLGEGGMGRVYLAEQSRPIRRTVALKILREGLDTTQARARFDVEREALARMDHPNIAKVLDAGVTDETLPYVVMEYVSGEPLNTYCDRTRRSIDERLDLFATVCDALQHAHQKGVLHRDVKPNNVLVTEVDGQPVVKVIDFGLAKSLGDPLGASSMHTQHGQALGTPAYMSPEQARGRNADVDVRTDVYALGVLLYELLTGDVPLGQDSVRRGNFAELLQRLQAEVPEKPSTRASTLDAGSTPAETGRASDATALRRRLRGDLDWITMRAMEKEPERRYGSALELAADIRRHKAKEPVKAGPPSAGYRVRKFVARHKTQVVAASLLLLTLTGGLIASLALYRTADVERDKAEAARAEAQDAKTIAQQRLVEAERSANQAAAANDFLGDLLSSVQPGRFGSDARVRDMLTPASATLTERYGDQPLVQAALHYTLGVTYLRLGALDEASDHLSAAVRLRAEHLPPLHAELVQAQLDHGECQLLQGDFELVSSALGPLVGQLRERSDVDALLVARAFELLGTARASAGDGPEAIRALESAISAYEAAEGPRSAVLIRPLLALAGSGLGLQEAPSDRASVRRAVEIAHSKLPPGDPRRLRADVAWLEVVLADGEYERAYPMAVSLVELTAKVFGVGHDVHLRALRSQQTALAAMGREGAAAAIAERLASLEARHARTGAADLSPSAASPGDESPAVASDTPEGLARLRQEAKAAMKRASMLSESGDDDGAAATSAVAASRARDALAMEGGGVVDAENLCSALRNLALHYSRLERWKDADAALSEAEAQSELLLAQDPNSHAYRALRAGIQLDRVLQAPRMPKADVSVRRAALATVCDALSGLERLVSEDPLSPSHWRALALGHRMAGDLLIQLLRAGDASDPGTPAPSLAALAESHAQAALKVLDLVEQSRGTAAATPRSEDRTGLGEERRLATLVLAEVCSRRGDLEAASSLLDETRKQSRNLDTGRIPTSRQRHSSLYRRLARALANAGRVERALKQFAHAEEILRTTSEEGIGSPLLHTERLLVRLDRATLHMQAGDLTEAQRVLENSLALADGALVADAAAQPDWVMVLGSFFDLKGSYHLHAGEIDRAVEPLELAVRYRQELSELAPHDVRRAADVAQSLLSLGKVRLLLSDSGPAQAAVHEALDRLKRASAATPESAPLLEALARGHFLGGEIELRGARYTEARDHFRLAIEEGRRAQEIAPNVGLSHNLMLFGKSFADAALQLGEQRAAVEALKESIAVGENLVRTWPAPRHRLTLALVLTTLANAHLRARQHGDRRAALERASELRRAILEENPEHVPNTVGYAISLTNLADAGFIDSDAESMEWVLEKTVEAADLLSRIPRDAPRPKERLSLEGYARAKASQALSFLGRHAEALATGEKAVGAIREIQLDPADTRRRDFLVTALHALGTAQDKTGSPREALRTFREAAELQQDIFARTKRPSHARYLGTLRQLVADRLSGLGEAESAMLEYERALRAYAPAGAAGIASAHLSATKCHRSWADALMDTEAYALAEAHYAEAITCYRAYAEAVAIDPKKAAATTAFLERLRLLPGLISGTTAPTTGAHHVALAEHHYAKGDYAAALAAYRLALADEDLRADIQRGALYNAACTAALLAAEVDASGPRNQLVDEAIAYLEEDQEGWRALLARVEASGNADTLARARALHEQHVEHARIRDPDLEILRTVPEFQEHFPAPDASPPSADPSR